MGRFSMCLTLLAALSCTIAVNRDNFKNCKASSFCSRQRNTEPSDSLYSVLPESIKVDAFGLIASLARENSEQVLSLEITYFGSSTFRVLVDEPSAQQPRYRLNAGDSLKTELKPRPINVIKSSYSVELVGTYNEKAILTLNPFKIDFYLDDVIVAQVNRRGLFNFEDKKQVKPSKTIEPERHSDNGDSKEIDPVSSDEGIHDSQPSEDSITSEEHVAETPAKSIEQKPLEDAQSNQENGNSDHLDPENQHVSTTEREVSTEAPPNPYPWEESFHQHRDTRPYGPTSLSMDIDFPGFAHAFGLPEHADSFVLSSTENGDPYRLYNLDVFQYELNNPMALYGAVPVMWALNHNHAVGVFWHNPSETWVDINYSDRPSDSLLSKIPRLFTKPEKYTMSRWISESGVLDVFIMLGHEPSDISKAYAHLTGTTPLPPLFALAYHQSRWNYNDEEDVLTLDQMFDKNGIPVDVIWLDIEHTDDKRYFTWSPTKFPNPGGMVDKLNANGRKLVTVVDPHIKQDAGWKIYSTGLDNGYFVKTHDNSTFIGWCWPGSSAWPDFTSPRIRNWWSELFLTYTPVRTDTMFTWNDMGEPSVFSGPEITMHKDVLHEGNREHRDIHNIYGLQIHRATWDGQLLRSKNQERPFVLTRAFFAGSQRTAAIWTGDNTADWGHLKITVPMMLSLSLTGITFSGADVGGFFGNPEPELLTRWYQAGAFQPFFRAHAHMDTKRREPWLLPPEYLNIVRDVILERYRLLPYWYTMFARAEADGQPVMAPIWYHFRELTSVYDLDNEYMIGEAMLVRPVVTQGARYVDVYLPPGQWYSYPPFTRFTGDQLIQLPVDMSTVPVFYRGGWIVPRRERYRRSSLLMRYDPFTLFVFIDPKLDTAQGYLYDDDYHSISRESAGFYHIEYTINRDTSDKTVAGGRLRMHRIPIPGTGEILKSRTTQPTPKFIERIVFVGLQLPLTRVTVISSDARREVEFFQRNTTSADKRFLNNVEDEVAVIARPMLTISADWELHLVTGTELKAEL